MSLDSPTADSGIVAPGASESEALGCRCGTLRGESYSNRGQGLRAYLAVTKALSDESRVRLLLALRGRELCLCQLVELVQLASSTVSKHMSILKHAQLVESRKEGRWMYYRLAESDLPPPARDFLASSVRLLDADPQIHRDQRRLEEILKLDPRDLCARSCPP